MLAVLPDREQGLVVLAPQVVVVLVEVQQAVIMQAINTAHMFMVVQVVQVVLLILLVQQVVLDMGKAIMVVQRAVQVVVRGHRVP